MFFGCSCGLLVSFPLNLVINSTSFSSVQGFAANGLRTLFDMETSEESTRRIHRFTLSSLEASDNGTGVRSRLTGTRRIRNRARLTETRSRTRTLGGSLIPRPRSTPGHPVEDDFDFDLHELSIANVQLINRNYCENEYRQILYTIALHGVKVTIHAYNYVVYIRC